MDNLEYRTYEAFIIRDTVEAARYCAKNNYDSMVIGCFYDPALQESREISGLSVITAPCQASLQIAANLGNRFSIIIGEDKWEDQMRETVYQYGYKDYLASFQSVGLRVVDFHKDPELTKERLVEAAMEAITEHGAEVIILGCTLEVGFYADLQEIIRERGGGDLRHEGLIVPVIDASIAGLKAAENAAIQTKYGWVTSRAYGMEAPPESELKAFDILQDNYKFGNSIVVPAE
ncbi:MAG: hydantoin racemase [Ekhidna sp.]|nr:hydantoin racemase [Ekhidna sp.]MBC6408908.1 hydantoin racemase [Ekhidna sp.]MBC6426503.1 hydantoin racemase [Ekhidna sp.]